MSTPFMWSLPPVASAAAAARQILRRRCSDVPAPVLEDALLLVSELVTNAVRHGQGPVTLTLTSADERVRVEVTDAGSARLKPRAAHPDAESGRGLHIVDLLATRWGATPTPPSGKTVWFELDLRDSSARTVT